MSGWWRENRWWLPAAPVALVAMAVSSGYLLHDYWWVKEPRTAIASGAQGDYVQVTGDYTDYLGTIKHTFEVQLSAIEETDEVTLDTFDGPVQVPDGDRAVLVDLDWKADPGQSMRGCTVALVDSDGRRYEQLYRNLEDPCVPDGHGGPALPAAEGFDREVPEGEERPPAWSTTPEFLIPDDVEITQVLVWWQLPDHVRLDVS